MFNRIGLFVLICCTAVAFSSLCVSESSAAPNRRRKATVNYTTKAPKMQTGTQKYTTNKPSIPNSVQALANSVSKPKTVTPAGRTYTCSEYELFGVNFSDEIGTLPTAEQELLTELQASYTPNYAKSIAERYPEVRPEVQTSLAEIAESVHKQKNKTEIGKIIHKMPVSTRQLSAKEVLAINQELAPAVDPEEYRAVNELNNFRMRSGLRPCVMDLLLCMVSRGHSSDMRRYGFFSHVSPVSGKNSFTMRARQMGANASAENIYMGSTSGRAANSAWANSSGHRANMLGGFSRVGVGRSGGHFTQMFGH
ncbi:MAG: CAP domain-containing protein [Planctomycetia bacterium]|nr:CAP domain-containing protein [Planctomycetia bacterium]